MSEAVRSLREQFAAYEGSENDFAFERMHLPRSLFGASAVWWFAHLVMPRYRLETDEEWQASREVIKSAADYRRDGGDCDDDVAFVLAWCRRQGVLATPVFLGKPARHVRLATAVGWVDRVPGTPRTGL